MCNPAAHLKCANLLVICLALGCGPKYELVPVSGKVTLDGKPLANAMILTQPIGKGTSTPGPGSGARLNDQGEFELELQTESTMGAVPGEHTVTIKELGEQRASNDDTGVAFKLRVPEEWRDGSATYTIPPEGTDAMIIELESSKRR